MALLWHRCIGFACEAAGQQTTALHVEVADSWEIAEADECGSEHARRRTLWSRSLAYKSQVLARDAA